MTCSYSNINQHDALYSVARAYPGGIEALAQRMSTPDRLVSPNVLRNKLRPAIGTHHANFEEVSQIVEFAEEARVPDAFLALHAFCWRHNHVAVRLPDGDVDTDDLLKQMVEIMSGDGALANDIGQALAGDHRIDAGELATIEGRIERCISALVVLRDKARAKHAADFPAAK